ncbi:hypothetical protein DFH09DRAFT_1087065 [Mycena vulgaris]|nr:hypothetical protein DFH09DRAFT_1087065 [Mycena vulgaris]
MVSSASVEPSRSPPHAHVHLGGYENIQYLSRDHFHYPGLPDAELGNDSPDEAIQRAVKVQWNDYIQKKPLTVCPSFAASPQSIYLGSRQSCDGQIVHDIVNLNSVQILYNRTDEQPCTFTGHLYSHLIQAPSSATTIWPLEVPYPSDEHIKEVMEQFTPLDQRHDRDNPAEPVPEPTQSEEQAPVVPKSTMDVPPAPLVIHIHKLTKRSRNCHRVVDIVADLHIPRCLAVHPLSPAMYPGFGDQKRKTPVGLVITGPVKLP